MKLPKILPAFLGIALLLFAMPASAHGLNVFAWLENDQILVQCDFGQGRPAANASITIYDNVDRKELAHGKTGPQGRYSFPVPAVVRRGHGLAIVADAGQGHRGEWTMDASELYAAASLTAGFDQAAIQASQQNGAESPLAGQAAGGQAGANPAQATQETPDHIHIQTAPTSMLYGHSPVTQEQVKNIVQEALELKLSPIRQEIAARSKSGPSYVEIIGGIGWIIGLVGIGLYFKSRKPSSQA